MFDLTIITHETDEEFTPDLQEFVYTNFDIDNWKTILVGKHKEVIGWLDNQDHFFPMMQAKNYHGNLVIMV